MQDTIFHVVFQSQENHMIQKKQERFTFGSLK